MPENSYSETFKRLAQKNTQEMVIDPGKQCCEVNFTLDYKFNHKNREVYNPPTIGLNDSFLKFQTKLWDINPKQIDIDLRRRTSTNLNLQKFKVMT